MLHELSTNAVKYGALSDGDGRVSIAWQKARSDGAAQLRLTWRERNGRLVSPPEQEGFGTQLIEGAVSYQLKGSVERSYADGGLSSEIVFPLS